MQWESQHNCMTFFLRRWKESLTDSHSLFGMHEMTEGEAPNGISCTDFMYRIHVQNSCKKEKKASPRFIHSSSMATAVSSSFIE